jgi:hypothetical protein
MITVKPDGTRVVDYSTFDKVDTSKMVVEYED